MVARSVSRLSYANVVATLALFMALSTGTVYAVNEWTGANIVDESLTYLDIAPASIGSGRIQDEGLGAIDLAPGSVGTSEIADGTVNAADLASNSVGTSEISIGAVGSSELLGDSVTSSKIIFDAVGAAEIASGAVGASEIASDAVGSSEIASGAVGTAEIANESVTATDLKGAYVNGIISLPGGAVPNGRCQNFEIGVPGASTDEAVVISLRTPAIPEGLVFYGVRVRLADTVVMAVCNLTGVLSPNLENIPIKVITFG